MEDHSSVLIIEKSTMLNLPVGVLIAGQGEGQLSPFLFAKIAVNCNLLQLVGLHLATSSSLRSEYHQPLSHSGPGQWPPDEEAQHAVPPTTPLIPLDIPTRVGVCHWFRLSLCIKLQVMWLC